MKTAVMARIPQGTGRQVAVVATAMALAIGAAWSGAATAQPGPAGGPPRMETHGPHGGHGRHGDRHGPRGEGHGFAGLFHGSPERIDRRVDRLLDGLRATDAQRAEIKRIARAAAADLQAQRVQGRALREQAMAAFTAPTVDPQAFERARQQRLAAHDAASRRVAQAMVDAARVLTPEQRATIGRRMADLQARMDDRRARAEERMRRVEREGGRHFGPGGPEGRGPRGMAPPAPPLPPSAPATAQPRS